MQVLSFWEKFQKHMSPGGNYGDVYCLVIGCKSCQRMQVLSLWEKIKNKCLPDAIMAEYIVVS